MKIPPYPFQFLIVLLSLLEPTLVRADPLNKDEMIRLYLQPGWMDHRQKEISNEIAELMARKPLNDADLAKKQAITDEINLMDEVKNEYGFAATDVEIQSAPCQHPAPNTQQIKSYFSNFSSGKPRQSRTLNGFTFKSEDPRLLSLYDMLVYPPEIQKARAAGKLSPNCDKVLCLMVALYGAEAGPRILYLAEKFNIIAGDQALVNAEGPLSPKDLDSMISIFQDLPPSMRLHGTPSWGRSEVVNALTLDYRKNGGSAAATYGDEEIQVYQSWRKYSVPRQKRAVFHEYGHWIAESKNFNESPEWLNLGDWKLVGGKWTSKNPHAISSYGSESPREDFAETVASYRYSPERLKKLSPEKYDFMKNRVFGGVEYLPGKTPCESKPSSDYCPPPAAPDTLFIQKTTDILKQQSQKH